MGSNLKVWNFEFQSLKCRSVRIIRTNIWKRKPYVTSDRRRVYLEPRRTICKLTMHLQTWSVQKLRFCVSCRMKLSCSLLHWRPELQSSWRILKIRWTVKRPSSLHLCRSSRRTWTVQLERLKWILEIVSLEVNKFRVLQFISRTPWSAARSPRKDEAVYGRV